MRLQHCLTTALALCLAAANADAGVIEPIGITVSTPGGSTSTTTPYTDDVYLETLTFSSSPSDITYDAGTGSFSVAQSFRVLSGRGNVNAEWGDTDDNADGDPDPFTKIGQGGVDMETTDPAIQDAALLNAFNSLSLTEMTDGEGSGTSFSFEVLFQNSLPASKAGDSLPDLLFFERNGNDVFQVSLITGRDPNGALVLTSALSVNSADFWDTDFDVDTTEIDGAQDMVVGGIDFSDFATLGLDTSAGGDQVYGFQLSASGNNGPDLGGMLLASDDPGDFGDPLTPVPLPPAMVLFLAAFGALGLVGRRRAST